jgi:hypothetical protein
VSDNKGRFVDIFSDIFEEFQEQVFVVTVYYFFGFNSDKVGVTGNFNMLYPLFSLPCQNAAVMFHRPVRIIFMQRILDDYLLIGMRFIHYRNRHIDRFVIIEANRIRESI